MSANNSPALGYDYGSDTSSNSDEVDVPHVQQHRRSTKEMMDQPKQRTTSTKAIITTDDNVDKDNGGEPATLDQGSAQANPFRLIDLPPELRCHIYSFVLAQNLTITFEKSGRGSDGKPVHFALGVREGGDVTLQIGGPSSYQEFKPLMYQLSCWRTVSRPKHSALETQLFRVSKFVCNEAQAILYGSNIYKFAVHGDALYPKSLRSPEVFGHLGHPDRLALLRNLRRIHIEVIPASDSKGHWVMKRQRSRLEYLVEILKEHADDHSQKSLLQELRIDFKLPVLLSLNDSGRRRNTDKFMFGLESLASLRGIKDVQFTGLPEWYAKCLQLSIQGKGGEVPETDWPLIEVTRRTNTKNAWSRKKIQHWVTTRKWYQPTLDWKEYAVRNNISIPDDIDKFWVATE